MENARQVLAKALRLEPLRVAEDACIRALPQWDSLGHMMLIGTVEEYLGAALDMDEILEMTTLQGLAAVLQKRQKT